MLWNFRTVCSWSRVLTQQCNTELGWQSQNTLCLCFLSCPLLQHEATWKWWPGRILKIPISRPCISRQRMNCPEGIISRHSLKVRTTSSMTLSPGILETGPQNLSMPTVMVFNNESLRYTLVYWLTPIFILFSHCPPFNLMLLLLLYSKNGSFWGSN